MKSTQPLPPSRAHPPRCSQRTCNACRLAWWGSRRKNRRVLAVPEVFIMVFIEFRTFVWLSGLKGSEVWLFAVLCGLHVSISGSIWCFMWFRAVCVACLEFWCVMFRDWFGVCRSFRNEFCCFWCFYPDWFCRYDCHLVSSTRLTAVPAFVWFICSHVPANLAIGLSSSFWTQTQNVCDIKSGKYVFFLLIL